MSLLYNEDKEEHVFFHVYKSTFFKQTNFTQTISNFLFLYDFSLLLSSCLFVAAHVSMQERQINEILFYFH